MKKLEFKNNIHIHTESKGEKYGKQWHHAYRTVNHQKQPVLIKKEKSSEKIIVPTKGYITRHHPQGAWDS
jgi:hypothetical protein